MRDELMVLTKSGEIEQKLLELRTEIEVRTRIALNLEVNEETYKEVKKVRAELNKDFAEVEDRRKALKKAFMKPYDEFEEIYKRNVTDVFKPAEQALKAKINDVENGIKSQRAEEVEAYFNEYAESIGIDDVSFDRTGVQVNLTDSVKKLKEKAKAWLDQRKQDIEWISGQEDAEEIFVEYDKIGNAIQAANVVKARKEAKATYLLKLERERQLREEEEKKAQKVLDSLEKPVEVPEEEIVKEPEIFEVTFTVKGTKEQISALKKYLIQEGLFNE